MKEKLISEIEKNVLPAWNSVLETSNQADHKFAVKEFLKSVISLKNDGAGDRLINKCKNQSEELFLYSQSREIEKSELDVLVKSIIEAKAILEHAELNDKNHIVGESRSKNKTII